MAAGISNTATMFDTKFYVIRKRRPRFIEPDGVLRAYDAEKAEGAHLLREISKDLEIKVRKGFYKEKAKETPDQSAFSIFRTFIYSTCHWTKIPRASPLCSLFCSFQTSTWCTSSGRPSTCSPIFFFASLSFFFFLAHNWLFSTFTARIPPSPT